MKYKGKTFILAIISVVLILGYLFYNLGANWGYILPRRGMKLLAIVLTGGAIALSTTIFQTITNNRILTPSVLGLDSLYLLIQTLIIFLFGSVIFVDLNPNINFILSVFIMVFFTKILFTILFKREGQNIYFLLLLGLIFGTLFSSFTSFMEVVIDPNEFQLVQDRMFASFNNVKTDLLWIAVIGILATVLYFLKFLKYLDVLALGRDQAIELGVDYDYVVKRLLIIVAILISIATALVGPITFLGLLVVNISYEFLKTYRHSYLILGSIFLSIIALVGGQFIVERVFAFSTTISVIINFIGGIYFIYLLLKENKSW
jgi:iron complex transport system permease protein